MVESWLFGVVASVFGLASVVVGLFMVRTGRRMRARNEGIDGTETTAVGDLEPGTARVRGAASRIESEGLAEGVTVRGDALVTVFEAERYSGGKGANWRTVYEERDAVPFVVDDGTGELRVDPPTDGRLDLAVAGRTRVGPGEDPPAPVQRLVDRESAIDEANEREVFGLQMGERRRYTEGVVAPGDEVVVYGELRRDDAGWDGTEFVLDGEPDPGSFLLSNKPDEQLESEATMRGGFGFLVTASGVMSIVFGLAVAVVPWVLL